ncbi:hypothetical protein [Ralstonia sp. 1B3]|uniref:hypothetical protein n=1 Tax=Ralstonia sp. 1B3 TaxID=2997421 RepID=UPI002FC988CC
MNKYGLGSYASTARTPPAREVYAVSGVPTNACSTYQPQGGTHTVTLTTPLAVEYRVIAAK